MKKSAFSFQLSAFRKCKGLFLRFFLAARSSQLAAGFTLIETLVAITLLTIAIVSPMTLTTKSLAAAYYARDEITAFYLAQEAIEALRSIRDAQILKIAQDTSDPPIFIDIFGNIPISSTGVDKPFTIDARKGDAVSAIKDCLGPCPPLQTDDTLYGYETGWKKTSFTRTVHASFVGGGTNEMRVTVTITWKTGAFQVRTFSISENLYRWLPDGVGGT